MSARTIIFDYFSGDVNADFESLMGFLDTDTLVKWFVSECYVEDLEGKEYDFIMDYYEKHC